MMPYILPSSKISATNIITFNEPHLASFKEAIAICHFSHHLANNVRLLDGGIEPYSKIHYKLSRPYLVPLKPQATHGGSLLCKISERQSNYGKEVKGLYPFPRDC
jgi:hypothetical protein